MKKIDCNIIKDLLPSYIDNLTSEESNILIANHLKECESCKETYNKMNKDININYDIDDSKISYMKKVHKKFKILTVCILILIIIVCISLYINYKSSHLFIDGKALKEQFAIVNNTYLFIECEDDNTITKFILTIDENDICQNTRKIRESKTNDGKKQINDEYNVINKVKENDTMHSNCELKGSTLYYNYNAWNGLEKNAIISQLEQYHDKLYVVEY